MNLGTKLDIHLLFGIDSEYCKVKAINFVYTCVVCLHTNIMNVYAMLFLAPI
jgi:hypothetical protein